MYQSIRTVVGLLALSGTLWTCQSRDAAIKEAENGVFAIHDEIMPEMDDIIKLKKQLNQRIALLDSSATTGSATATLRTGEEKEQAVRLRRNLVVADSLMTEWMDHYNGDTLAKLSSEEAMQYLAAQKEQITDVRTKFTTSIAQARQFLDKK